MSWADKTPEGFGANVTGGAGGTVRTVTNLNDSGAGSLRDAILSGGTGGGTAGPRIVQFSPSLSGTILLQSEVNMVNGSGGNGNFDDLTIDGSIAGNQGVQIAGQTLNLGADNILIKHLKVRVGERGTSSIDGILLNSATNVFINHCSFAAGDDGNLDIIEDCENITIQYCIFGPACGVGSILIRGAGATLGRMSIHHNLFVTTGRPGDTAGTCRIDYVNNVVFSNRPAINNIHGWGMNEGAVLSNIVNNYYKMGTNTTPGQYDYPIYLQCGHAFVVSSAFYIAGNVWMDSGDEIYRSQQDQIYYTNDGEVTINGTPFEYPTITTTSAAQAYADVLAYAGAHQPCGLDALDRTLIGYAQNGNGVTNPVLSSIDDIGGYPDLTQPCGSSASVRLAYNLG